MAYVPPKFDEMKQHQINDFFINYAVDQGLNEKNFDEISQKLDAQAIADINTHIGMNEFKTIFMHHAKQAAYKKLAGASRIPTSRIEQIINAYYGAKEIAKYLGDDSVEAIIFNKIADQKDEEFSTAAILITDAIRDVVRQY